MAEDPLQLEDLDDEGEEVDYEDFNLEDFGEASTPLLGPPETPPGFLPLNSPSPLLGAQRMSQRKT